MSADKRQFSDFTKFPGSIDTSGAYVFPILYHSDSNDNKRIWTIYVRLVKGSEKKYKLDWDLMKDDTIPVKASYLDGVEIPEGTITQVWVETGVIGGKISRHPPTYTHTKNAGKSNERNSFEQGLVLARSQYLKRLENGLSVSQNAKHRKARNIMYFPMLVCKYEDEKRNLEYPLFIQPKLDGARCVAFLNESPRKDPTFENVILYSRQKKDYLGFDELRKELLIILIDLWDFKSNQSIYIDGELYKHGLNLQTISGAVRNPDRDNMPEYKGIKFHIFDIFYPLTPKLKFAERMKFLSEIDESKNIEKVETIEVKSEEVQEKMYKRFLDRKYEGIIIRNASSLYLTHPTKNSNAIRSKFVLKRKMTYSDEFEVVGFEQGDKGRDKGAIMWICKTQDTDKIFSATPKNITYDERYKLFKEAAHNSGSGFNEKYKGRMMTIEYEDLSKDKIPLRAKAVGFREHI